LCKDKCLANEKQWRLHEAQQTAWRKTKLMIKSNAPWDNRCEPDQDYKLTITEKPKRKKEKRGTRGGGG
jgi:hypothetical protein